MSDRRLEDARERLQRALIEGKDTNQIRESIRRMEVDIEAARLRQSAESAEAAKSRDAEIERRASELVQQARARLDADLNRYSTEDFAR